MVAAGRMLVLALALSVMAHTASAMRCVKSGMCSLGQLKPYNGDIADTKGLAAAAEARSYKKEIILVLTFPNRVLDIKLLMGNWAKLGMEHVLLLGDRQDTCTVVARELPNVGCVWDSVPLDDVLGGVFRAWHIRYRMLARLVRMGYNVFLADSDIVVFDDPYRYWKAPPFNNFTIINAAEILYRGESYHGVDQGNGGVFYIQNAKRDGVAAWLVAEVCDRFLRWADDNYALMTSKGVTRDANTMDQSALQDAMSSVATGRPHFLQTMLAFWDKSDPGRARVHQNTQRVVHQMWQHQDVALPRFMHETASGNSTHFKWLDMVMPHTEGKWPDEFGGRWYPETRGNRSKAFLELLKLDCNGCALWPDVEDPATLQAARAVPREKYLLAPPWLMCGYNAQGGTGSWLPDANGRVQQVVGHGHYMPAALNIHKLIWRQFVDSYDWALAEQHWGTQFVFQANMQDSRFDSTPYIEDNPSPPRLLVMYSRMRLNKLRNIDEYMQVLKGAMQIAALSNRTLVWPDLPCDLSFVGKVDSTTGLLSTDWPDIWYPYGGRFDKMRCLFTFLLQPQCLIDRRGMMGTEYQHFVQRYGVAYDMEPHIGNTAFFPIHNQLHASLDTHESPASAMVEVTQFDAQSHLDDLEQAQVVFLAHPVKVANYTVRNWGCLDDSTTKRIYESFGGNRGPTTVKVTPGRVVNGRLTTEGGYSPLPTTPTTRKHSAAVANYAGRPQASRSGPAAFCKPI